MYVIILVRFFLVRALSFCQFLACTNTVCLSVSCLYEHDLLYPFLACTNTFCPFPVCTNTICSIPFLLVRIQFVCPFPVCTNTICSILFLLVQIQFVRFLLGRSDNVESRPVVKSVRFLFKFKTTKQRQKQSKQTTTTLF